MRRGPGNNFLEGKRRISFAVQQPYSRKTSSFIAIPCQDKMKKTLIFILIIFSSLSGFVLLSFKLFGIFAPQTQNIQVPTNENINHVSVIIDFGDRQVQTSRVNFTGSLSAYDALKNICDVNGFEINTQEYDFGIFIESVNGYESSQEKAWIYYVNGESGNIAADQNILKSGDLVEWKYISPN